MTDHEFWDLLISDFDKRAEEIVASMHHEVNRVIKEGLMDAAFSGKAVVIDIFGFRYFCPPDMSHIGMMKLPDGDV